jgi:hypothetical protein
MRAWTTVTSWGGGLIQFAIGAGLITGTSALAPRGYGLVLVVTAADSLMWAALHLAGRAPARWGVAFAVAGVILTGASVAVDTGRASVLAIGAGVALWAAAGATAAASTRPPRRTASAQPGRAPRRRDGVTGMLIAAVAVAGVVTPALASTEAGRLAPDHSAHTVVFDGGHGH